MRGALRRDPTIRRDGVRSLGRGLLAKKEALRMAVYVLEAPSIGLTVVEMVVPPSDSVSSLLAPAALR
jgi:hypothetical protein